MAEGRAEANRQWDAWNQRRIAAKNAGLPFTEPTPYQKNRP